jgi:hypothetical protein
MKKVRLSPTKKVKVSPCCASNQIEEFPDFISLKIVSHQIRLPLNINSYLCISLAKLSRVGFVNLTSSFGLEAGHYIDEIPLSIFFCSLSFPMEGASTADKCTNQTEQKPKESVYQIHKKSNPIFYVIGFLLGWWFYHFMETRKRK